MARTRNIKPGFFTHEGMAENCALGRLLFLGLTTIADFKGEIEWRPKRIKVQLLPYDDCDIDSLAINLDKSGFVRFYSDGVKTYLKIVNFAKHQNPHKNERDAGSDIPEFSEEMRQVFESKEVTINRDLSGSNLEQDGTDPALSLIPSSSNLPPSTNHLDLGDQQADAPKAKRKTRLPADFLLTDERRQSALKLWGDINRLDLNAETEFDKFLTHHKAHGDTYLDWDACWRTWYCNAPKFNRAPLAVVPAKGSRHQNFDQIDYSAGVNPDGTF